MPRGRVKERWPAVCPECGDEGRTCEHRCYECDRVVPNGTCTNGRCEECCADHCEDA